MERLMLKDGCKGTHQDATQHDFKWWASSYIFFVVVAALGVIKIFDCNICKKISSCTWKSLRKVCEEKKYSEKCENEREEKCVLTKKSEKWLRVLLSIILTSSVYCGLQS